MRTIHFDYSTLKPIRIKFDRNWTSECLFVCPFSHFCSLLNALSRSVSTLTLFGKIVLIFSLLLYFDSNSCFLKSHSCIHPSNMPKRTSDKNDTVTLKKQKTIMFLCTYSIVICKWVIYMTDLFYNQYERKKIISNHFSYVINIYICTGIYILFVIHVYNIEF